MYKQKFLFDRHGPTQKVYINDALAAKAKDSMDLVKETFGSLERINSLFAFENDSNKVLTNLTKERHEKLCKLGLLKNEGGLCQKCSVQLRLIKHKRKDGLMWKCTKCKVATKPTRKNSTFHNSKIAIYQIIVLISKITGEPQRYQKLICIEAYFLG